MVTVIPILASLVLFAGFFVLAAYEERRGIRVFAEFRGRLDHDVTRAVFIVTHVDLGAFLVDEMRRIAVRVGHDVTHVSLLGVRAAERLLTRAIRHFRARREVDVVPARESERGYVKALSDFKSRLKAARADDSGNQHSV